MLPSGIESLNLAAVKEIVNSLSQKEKNEILTDSSKLMYINDSKDILDKKRINMGGYDVAASDYIQALSSVIKNPNVSKEQVPIIINKNFYEKAKQAHGPLTKKEEKKAKEYLKAYENYPFDVSSKFRDKINPHSDYWKVYRKNIMEQRAFSTPCPGI